ncbi:MAG: DNA methyltransferase [Pyrinomonadaceae bacterium]
MEHHLLTIKEASSWATEHTGKRITTSNISYLLNYGRIKKLARNGEVYVSKNDLQHYYEKYDRASSWKAKLGGDLNWALSFEQYKESETTKHVHRLHPYKGKFIPQLVEYFLDSHTDEFKKQQFFKPYDIVYDPFCGSGTTLVQANELGINALGVDVSEFNSLISNIKISEYDFLDVTTALNNITWKLREFVANGNQIPFENAVLKLLGEYNEQFFPSPEFKIKVRKKEIDEKVYPLKFVKLVEARYLKMVDEFKINLQQSASKRFLDNWYLPTVRNEIDFVSEQIEKVTNPQTKNLLTVILSRTIRSCRATTHSDLATLLEPITKPYYCRKHGKICKPLFSMLSWWERYSKDTIGRLRYFDKIKTDTFQTCLNGNSENIPLLQELQKRNSKFAKLLNSQKIRGIFSSPPYVGLIDYHEQHAYAYDLFGFERKDDLEIGAMHKKQSKVAQTEYVNGISNVLKNSRKFMVDDFDVFLVANDKFNLYPQIAENAQMQIMNQYKRPVLNRTEKDKQAYAEIIFHMKAV